MENEQKEDSEALFAHRDRNKRPQFIPRFHNSPTAQNPRFVPNGRWRSNVGTQSANRPFNQESQGGSTSRHQRSSSSTQYQPRYQNRGPDRPRNDKCDFCGPPECERECDLRSILDRMKDYEHRLLEQRQRNLNGQVHHLEEPSDSFSQDDPSEDHETANQVVNACLIELNLVETPQNTASWYLDSGATHHVSGEKSAFTSINPTSGAQIRSTGGHSHSVARVGNVALQLSSGEIKSINSVLYAPGITKNLLSVGALADQHKTLVFKSTGCFVFNNSNL